LEDLKSGKFDLSFEIALCTNETKENVRRQILMISELDQVSVEPVEAAAHPSVSLEPVALHAAQEIQGEEASRGQAVQAKLAAGQAGGAHARKIQSMRIPVERLDKIMNLMGELAIARIRLVQISQSSQNEALEDVSSVLDRLISALQDEIMQTRLLPVAYILDTFPRMVRDLAKKQNKEINLEMVGSEIELDRVALDELSDPMVHLIRNAIDHGIESAEERKARKKDPSGKLLIQVSRQKGQIVIEVVDDGRGVDFEAVKKIALSKALITKEEMAGLDEKKILDLLTLPGFSTAKKVTDISGRGVGLDVVKSKIEALNGRLEFETKLGEGSKFILTLPLTLAIIKAMLVEVGNEIFAIPLMSVREIIKINEEELKMLQSFEVARVRDEIIPIVRLNKELDISLEDVKRKGIDDRLSVIIIEYGKKALGLVVSAVLGEQDIVVKPLGAMVKRTKGIAGATILGDGKVALILDTMSLR
jgi:two-component system chemotaxis sensor kinase CheA